ncbi:MAG: putative 2-aminoethylphosphonate ABC transporter substrate-binding protein, partial [Clostridia bacterium]
MKKWLRPLALAALSLAVLGGCGGNGGNSSQTSAPAGNQTESGQTASSGPKEITVYTALEDDQIKAYLESFKK